MIKASRVMKARRQGFCPLCRTLILVGQPICQLGATGCWIHVSCLIKRNKERAGQ